MDFFYMPFLSNFVTDSDSNNSLSSNEARYQIVSNQKNVETNEPRYKFTYLNGRGLAEICRLILVYRGIDFVDVRLNYSMWRRNISSTICYQLLPLLEFDGKMICQAPAIARYLARIYGLAGKDPYEQAQVDSVVDILKDFQDACAPHMSYAVAKTQDIQLAFKDPVVRAHVINSVTPLLHQRYPLLQAAAKNCEKHRHGFIFESGLTYADFAVTSFCESLETLVPGIIQHYPPLGSLIDRVQSLPELQQYLASRPPIFE